MSSRLKAKHNIDSRIWSSNTMKNAESSSQARIWKWWCRIFLPLIPMQICRRRLPKPQFFSSNCTERHQHVTQACDDVQIWKESWMLAGQTFCNISKMNQLVWLENRKQTGIKVKKKWGIIIDGGIHEERGECVIYLKWYTALPFFHLLFLYLAGISYSPLLSA